MDLQDLSRKLLRHLIAPAPVHGRGDLGRPRGPWAFVGMVSLIVGFECYLYRHSTDFTNEPAQDWVLTRSATSREARDAQILCFGDSLIKFGVLPNLLESRTGLTSFNLAVMGGQGPSTYFLLRRAIEAGARPRAIVVDCQDAPAVVGVEGRGYGLWPHRRNWHELLDTRDSVDLSWTARDATFFTLTTLARIFPSVKARDEIRVHYRHMFRRKGTAARYLANVQRRNWEINKGGLLMARKREDRTAITGSLAAAPTVRWTADPVSQDYIRRFLVETARGDIPVFWLIPPTSPEHQALRVRIGHDDYFTQLALKLRADFPNVVVLDARNSGYGRSVFVDDTHLDRVGSATLSVDVGEAIARSLAQGGNPDRWVKLPDYRERPDGGPLEDLEGSRIALDPNWRPRR